MKNLVLFLMIICLAIGTYAFNISESYKVDRSILTEEVFLGDYDIKIHGNRYSISEWWQDQPKIQLDYEGEEVVFQAIEKALQSLGFVFGGGDSFHLKTEIINNRFLYIETSYKGLEKNNMDSLMIIDEDNSSQFRDYFHDAYGDYSNNLPKLILIHTEEFLEVNGEILYKGPDYSIVKIYEENLKLTVDNQIMEFECPFYPVLFLDLTQTQYLLTINSQSQQTIFIDGEMFQAPVKVYLSEGVHQVEYADRSQYIYMKKQMEFSLDDVVDAELTIVLNIPSRVCILKDNVVVDHFEANSKRIQLPP